jgi:hypothetical protein
MFKAMRKHAHKKRDEKAGYDVEEGDLRDESSSSSNLGGGTNQEGVELIDHHHHHEREMKVRQVMEGRRQGRSLCLDSWCGGGRQGKRTLERYLALIGGVCVCAVVMTKTGAKHKAYTETAIQTYNDREKGRRLTALTR